MTLWNRLETPPGALFESARWVSEASAFQWVDILRPAVYRWRIGEQVEVRRLDLDFAACALPLDADVSILASGSELFHFRWSDGHLDHLASFDLPDGVRFNDGNISPRGELFIGTMSQQVGTRLGNLFRFDPDFQIHVSIPNVGISNGLVWTNPRTALYVDSTARTIDRVIDLGTSQQVVEQVLRFPPGVEPDGLAISPDSSTWVALWDGHAITCVDGVAAGRSVPVPGRRPTSLAFGHEVAIVTLAEESSGAGNAQVIWTRLASGGLSF